MYFVISFLRHIRSFIIKIKLMLNFNNVRIGRGVYLDSNVNLLGNNLINDYTRLVDTCIGEYSYISPMSILVNVSIGRYCSIGPGCKIGLGFHPVDSLSTSPYIFNEQLFKSRRKEDFIRTIIGNDVWIGANVSILGGITVGTGSILGAGAVVTKDVPPYSIAVGCPARVIKKRFSDKKIEELLSSNWWEETPDIIKHKYEKEI